MVDWRRIEGWLTPPPASRQMHQQSACPLGWSPIKRSRLADHLQEEKIPGKRSLGRMKECRVWEILFKQEYVYPVPCELWAGQQKLMFKLSAGELGGAELRGKGDF